MFPYGLPEAPQDRFFVPARYKRGSQQCGPFLFPSEGYAEITFLESPQARLARDQRPCPRNGQIP